MSAGLLAAGGPAWLAYSFQMPRKPEVSCKFAPGSLLCLNERGEVAFNVPDRTPEVIRARIKDLAQKMLAMPDRREFEVRHELAGKLYKRTLFIPKGSVLVGKTHLKHCINFVEQGDISVLTETGAGRFKTGYCAASEPGIQKLGYAHEDTIFVNVFHTDETDISTIEAEIATDKELLCL